MFRSFLSVVVVVDAADEQGSIEVFLTAVGGYLSRTFSDYEIVLVDNVSGVDLGALNVPEKIRANCYLMKLAKLVSLDTAIFSGFERANGDYTVLFDVNLESNVELIGEMYERAQKGRDLVLLRDKHAPRRYSLSSAMFFAVIRQAGGGSIDARDRKEILISRRALNWILRYRNRSAYLGELYAVCGYQMDVIEVDIPQRSRQRKREDRQRLAWAALTRMTSLPLQIATLSILVLVAGLFILSANALSVRFFEHTLLGEHMVAVPGWTYLVILMSSAFLLTNITLYALLRVLLVMSEDVRKEPNYIVEAYRRL